MFSLLRLCFVFNGEIYATEWAVFVSVDITFYSFALSYLLDFSFLHHICRSRLTLHQCLLIFNQYKPLVIFGSEN